MLHLGSGHYSGAFLWREGGVEGGYFICDEFFESCGVDVDEEEVFGGEFALLEEMGLLEVLGEALDDVVAVSPAQRLHLTDYRLDAGLV